VLYSKLGVQGAQAPTVGRQGQAKGTQHYMSTRRNLWEKNTHIGIRQQELAKGARQQKEEKEKKEQEVLGRTNRPSLIRHGPH
jgi:hypothetical protein